MTQTAAADQTQLHLGLESSIYTSSSISGDGEVASTSGTTSVHYEQKVSELGFPGSTYLSLGALMSDQWDLGFRFAYASHKTEDAANRSNTTISSTEFQPYLAFVTGSRRDPVRASFGVLFGIGSASVKSSIDSTNSGTGLPSTTSIDSSADAKSYGGFFRVYGFLADSASIDPALSVMGTSASSSGTSLSGMTYMFSVGVSLWPSRSVPPVEEPAQRRHSTRTPEASSPRVSAVLNFGGERTIAFVRKTNGAEPAVAVLVRDPVQEHVLVSCNQLTFHAPGQQDESVDAAHATASSQGLTFSVLRALVSVETLRNLVKAPIANNASTPEHWIYVCNQRWPIREQERARLRDFVETLPVSKPAPASEPSAPAGEPSDAKGPESTSE